MVFSINFNLLYYHSVNTFTLAIINLRKEGDYMLVRHFEKTKFHRAYNIFVQSLLPTDDVKPPFQSAFGTIPPKGQITPHMSQEAETFFIIKGNGEMIVQGETHKVLENDVISVPAFTRHSLKNTDEEKDLVFLTVCWMEKEKQSEIDHYLLLTPFPAIKEKLYQDYIASSYLAADIYKRFLQIDGKKVMHVIGRNHFQNRISADSKVTTDDHFKKTLQNYDIEIDSFKIAHDLEHQKNTQKLVQEMYDRGLFIAKKENAYDHQQMIDKAFVEEICPKCFRYLYEEHLCKSCGTKGYRLESKIPSTNSLHITEGKERLFFPLSKYKDELRDFYEEIEMTESLRDFCEVILQRDLPDIPVSFHGDKGIEMPISTYKEQKISVPIEIIAHSISSISKVENENEPHKTKKVQFIDLDDRFLYVVILPAMYMALYPQKKFVDSYAITECSPFEERRHSTSNNSPIWGDEIVKNSSDIVRLYLSYKNYQSNYSKLEFKTFVSIFNQLMIDYINEMKMEFQLVGNNLSIDILELSEDEKGILRHIQKAIDTTYAHYQIKAFSPENIVKTVCRLLNRVKRFNQSKSPNKLAINFLVIRHISRMIYPITPRLSNKINQLLFQTSKITWLHKVNILKDYFIDPTINFKKVEVAQII